MEYKDLDRELELHKMWLQHEKGGKRLILSKKNLKNMVIRDKDLTKCVAILTDFTGADLRGSCLKDAILDDADMSYANLEGADIRGASLKGTKMTGVKFGICVSGVSNRQSINEILNNSYDVNTLYDSRRELTEQDLDDIAELEVDRRLERAQKIISNLVYEDD